MGLIERGHVPGLKSPEHLLAFAKLGETEMAELRRPLYRSQLSLAQSRKFLLEKTNNGELDWDWTARQFLSLMNGQDKQVCTRVLLTPRGKFAWTMELRKIERQNNDENEEQS